MASTPSIHPAEELLRRAHPSDIAETIFREKVQLRPLLLRPTSPDPALNARSKRQHDRLCKARADRKSKKPRPLSAKQKRALGVYEIPKEQRKFAIYEPLHEMWCGYMREILGLQDSPTSIAAATTTAKTTAEESVGKRKYVNAVSSGHLLVTADYHGAKVTVVRSRCVSRVGIEGIVVKDTKFTFEIITKRDEIKVVPKEHTVFRFEIPLVKSDQDGGRNSDGETVKPFVFEIMGSQFENRAPERANRKFRARWDPNL